MRHSETKITIIIIKDMHMHSGVCAPSKMAAVTPTSAHNGQTALDPLCRAWQKEEEEEEEVELGLAKRNRSIYTAKYSARMMMSLSCNVRSQISLNNDC